MTDAMDVYLRDLFSRSRGWSPMMARAYETALHSKPPRHRGVTIAWARCRDRKRCLLLAVWSSPRGRLVYLPSYRLSESKNAETALAARNRHGAEAGSWPASCLDLDDFLLGPDTLRIPVHCKHADTSVSAGEIAEAVGRARPGAPVEMTLSQR